MSRHVVRATLPPNLPMEAFGVLLKPGPLPNMVLERLEQRRKEWFCPFLMATCPRPYPICSVDEAGTPVAICPHRLLEGQAIFRSLTSSIPGSLPTLLRHVHPSRGAPVLGWVLFGANQPDLWIGINTMTPLPPEESALAWASHDVFEHGRLREEGYDLFFDWPTSAAAGYQWLTRLADGARLSHRPVFDFMPTPLFERLRALVDLSGDDLSPARLVPVDLERGTSELRLRVAVSPAPRPAPTDHGEVWKTILRRWTDWISLEAVSEIAMKFDSIG